MSRRRGLRSASGIAVKHQPRHYLAFATLRLEGGLFLPDQLEKAALGGAARFQSEADYHTPKGLKLKDDTSRAFQIASAQWKHFADQFERSDVDADALTRHFVGALPGRKKAHGSAKVCARALPKPC